ncbi:MAG: type III-B CRISPR-associated protein Cas10/Cmr2, partial [Dehalococcoidia bacterium]
MIDWQLKQKAFLDALLGKEEQTQTLAYGLDRPPFVAAYSPNECQGNPKAINPLCGEPFPLDGSQNTAWLNQQTIDDAVHKDTDQRQYLKIWRDLPEILREKAESKLKPYWDILPADPRMPSQSIWQHASLTSAFAGTNENGQFKPALLMFTLASPQEFVSTARRTQDFWMGSFLYSYFSWKAIEAIASECGPDCFINPSLRGEPLADWWLHKEGIRPLQGGDLDELKDLLKVPSVPNIFTALVPAESAQSYAEKAEKAIRTVRDQVFNKVKAYVEDAATQAEITLKGDLEWDSAWERQRKDFLEPNLFWVAYAFPEGDEAFNRYAKLQPPSEPHQVSVQKDIKDLYDLQDGQKNMGMAYPVVAPLTARFFSTRKNLRHFDQVCEPNQKCSQCGIREALHPERKDKKANNYQELRLFWEDLAKIGADEKVDKVKKKLAGRIRKGDRL